MLFGIFRKIYFKVLNTVFSALLGNNKYAALSGYTWCSYLVYPKHFQSQQASTYEPLAVVVGANIGANSNDPIYSGLISDGRWSKQNWKGIFVEPVPNTMRVLKWMFKDLPNAEFLEVAVAKTEKRVEEGVMHVPVAPDVPGQGAAFVGQISSLRKDYVESYQNGTQWTEHSHADSDFALKSTLQKINVKCMNFENAMRATEYLRTGNAIDFLVLDVEGTNSEVLESILDSTIRPRGMLFEHGSMYHFESPSYKTEFTSKAFPGDQIDAHVMYWAGKLINLGYIVVMLSNFDMFAISADHHQLCLQDVKYRAMFQKYSTLMLPPLSQHDLPFYRFRPFVYSLDWCLSFLKGKIWC